MQEMIVLVLDNGCEWFESKGTATGGQGHI